MAVTLCLKTCCQHVLNVLLTCFNSKADPVGQLSQLAWYQSTILRDSLAKPTSIFSCFQKCIFQIYWNIFLC